MKELLISSLLGIIVLAADVLKLRKAVFPIVILGLIGLIVSCGLDWNMNENPMDNNMLLMDNFALAFTGTLAGIALVWFLMTSDYFGNESKRTDLYALVIFSLCGAFMLVSYSNLVMLFLGIEILSIPMYVLAASKKGDVLSNEAGFKYFFLGAVASAILLFGIAMVYGATGTFDLMELSGKINSGNLLMNAGIIMILAGFAFKISAAPFHFWTPDVYQGSPTVITALMATMVKGAAFASMLRLFDGAFVGADAITADAMAILSAITLVAANAVAAVQSNAKRMLAYSSISHAGFMLAAVFTAADPNVMLYYLITYSAASLASFGVLYHVSKIQNGAEGIDAFKGLVRRNPIMAGTMTLALLSMAGIPPLSGFMAKYQVINATINDGYVWLAIIMILTSVVAVFYYLKLIIAMFTPIENAGRIALTGLQKVIFILLTLAMIGLFFTPFVRG